MSDKLFQENARTHTGTQFCYYLACFKWQEGSTFCAHFALLLCLSEEFYIKASKKEMGQKLGLHFFFFY